ncbi:pleckstrin homology domain-containing family G member 7-like [Liolophura sinensis]|uniref:pleckstrin homology domain-containing family G member 7-like n=1 Tax=Liolophura sinensis TaxID=3198878 RepID=UPI0031582E0D
MVSDHLQQDVRLPIQMYSESPRGLCKKRVLSRGFSLDSISLQPLLKPVKRTSLGSLSSVSDDSEFEPSPPFPRRGRRYAIDETKHVGDCSPESLSPEPEILWEDLEHNSVMAHREGRRRSSLDLPLEVNSRDCLLQKPTRKPLVRQHTIADFAALRQSSSTSTTPTDDSKKPRQTFSLLKLMKSRSKESLSQLSDALSQINRSEFKDAHLTRYKNAHWSDLITDPDIKREVTNLQEPEGKRREAVWELFKSECVFLIDHLMVLKHCFLEPLKKLQVDGFLMYAEPAELFSNLDELCYVSYTFCKDFISVILKDLSYRPTEFGRTKILIKTFHRFSALSRDAGVFHSYCLNYVNALGYLERLLKNDDFADFIKWCEQDARCKRLQITDLLVAPVQRCTKLPLILSNIRNYTKDPEEKRQLSESIQTVEKSLRNLEDKLKWVRNLERVQEIQQNLVWPSVTELDPRGYIPEFLRPLVSKQPCERLLASPKRRLLYEGPVTLLETTKTAEMYLFLFDDILLLARIKRPLKKKQTSTESSTKSSCTVNDGSKYTVYRQPIPLDRFAVYDVSANETSSSSCDSLTKWLTCLRDAKDRHMGATEIIEKEGPPDVRINGLVETGFSCQKKHFRPMRRCKTQNYDNTCRHRTEKHLSLDTDYC